MSSSDLRLLRLPKEVWIHLRSTNARRLSRYVVDSTAFTATWRVSLILVDSDLVGAAIVRRYGRPGYGQDGLEMRSSEPFAHHISWSKLVAAIPRRHQSVLDRNDGKAFSPRSGEAVEDALSRVVPGRISCWHGSVDCSIRTNHLGVVGHFSGNSATPLRSDWKSRGSIAEQCSV